ncbi:VOC family protein [Meiothermus sp. QL-1]|uniref:VOC family protein n=1 Tax=Meiothermus sp. QL-1 TaxID=2058095 RepID=UPI000E0AB20C|nr:VOC family protein [Meiothermus sp. QL-1]RDI96602.1 VOC family protein [Meiothermus sp. QL-1]
MRIHHVALVVEDLEKAAQPYLRLGYTLEAQGRLEGLEVWMLKSGASRIELLQPIQPHTAAARFLRKRGPGLHHLALATPHLQTTLEHLAAQGAPLLEPSPRPGLGGPVAFIHPRWASGVLLELVETPE